MHIYMKRLKIYNYIFLIFLRPLWNYWPPFKFLINIVLIGNPKFTRPFTFIISVRDIVNTGFPIKYTRCCNWQTGQGSSTSAGNVWKDGDASGSSVGPVLETVINTIYLKIIYLLNIYIISLSGDWLLYKGIPHQETKDKATRTLLKTAVNSGAPAHRTVTTNEVDEGVFSSDFLGAKQREREKGKKKDCELTSTDFNHRSWQF